MYLNALTLILIAEAWKWSVSLEKMNENALELTVNKFLINTNALHSEFFINSL